MLKGMTLPPTWKEKPQLTVVLPDVCQLCSHFVLTVRNASLLSFLDVSLQNMLLKDAAHRLKKAPFWSCDQIQNYTTKLSF